MPGHLHPFSGALTDHTDPFAPERCRSQTGPAGAQPVIVLFVPARPRRNTAYEFGGYGLKDFPAGERLVNF